MRAARPHSTCARPRAVHQRRPQRSAPTVQERASVRARTASPTSTAAVDVAAAPLISLSDEETRLQSAAAFERVDDVVMGGVSSSRVVASKQRETLMWQGHVRTDGGGFAGFRSRTFDTPLDLSAYDGLSIAAALESDADVERRTWKCTLRTQNNRGELVYQAFYTPEVGDEGGAAPKATQIPWENFRLVRGPVVVPDVPPLSAEQCSAVYGVGLIMSRFGPQGPMPDFRDGRFQLAIHALGVYSAAAAPPPAPLLTAATTDIDTANRGSTSALGLILGPLIKLIFSERVRRRRQARLLLQRRFGFSSLRARAFGQRLKARRSAPLGEGARELAVDAAAAFFTLPVRVLFKLAGTVARIVRKLKGEKPLPRMA